MTDLQPWVVRMDQQQDISPGYVSPAQQQVSEVDYGLVRDIQTRVNQIISDRTGDSDRLTAEQQRVLAMQLIVADLERMRLDAFRTGDRWISPPEERQLRDAVIAAMFGLGRLEQLLLDPDIEDIYIRGTRPVIVKFAGGRRELRPPVADSNESLLQLLQQIATHHGQNARSVTSSKPWLDLRLPGRSRLAAVWDVVPEPTLTIRRHRYVDITLEKLVGMGTLSPAMAAFLHAAVLGRRNILVVGGQSVGKTTILRAFAQCLPRTTRFATLETEYELLLHEIPGDRFPGLMAYEARPGTGEPGPDGKPAGEVTVADLFPTSLRHSLDRCIVGECRSAEVIALLQAMSRGYKGSMGTFHADSPLETFDALASLLSEHKANWSKDAAMHQISTALDLIVFLDREDTSEGEKRYVSHIVEVGQVAEMGQPQTTYIFAPLAQQQDLRKSNSASLGSWEPDGREESDPRGYPFSKPGDPRWAVRAGLDLKWLDRAAGEWTQPFPRPVWGGDE